MPKKMTRKQSSESVCLDNAWFKSSLAKEDLAVLYIWKRTDASATTILKQNVTIRELDIEHCTFIPSKKSSPDPFTAKPSFARLLVAPASVDISQGEHLLQRRIFNSLSSYFFL